MMISKKYISDYRVAERIDSRGRVVSEAIYIGGDYALAPPLSKRVRLAVFAASVLGWVCFFLALVPESRAARLIYAAPPFVLSALPLYFMTASAYSYARLRDVTTRRDAETIAARLPSCSLICAVLTLTALAGTAVTLFRSGVFMPGDVIFCASALVSAAGYAFVFFRCKNLKSRLVSPSGTEERFGHNTFNVPKIKRRKTKNEQKRKENSGSAAGDAAGDVRRGLRRNRNAGSGQGGRSGR